MSDKKYEKAKEKVLIIKAIARKYGTTQWYTEKGKLLAQGNSPGDVQKEVMKYIKPRLDKLTGHDIIEIQINFDTDKDFLMNKKYGGIQVIVTIYTINKVLGKIAPMLRDKNHSLIVLYYDYKHLDDFQISDLKKFAKLVYEKKYKIKLFSGYHYQDIKDDLK